MNFKNSKTMYEEAVKYLPAGVNSPVRAFRQVGGHPIFIKHAEGCYIYDVDNNSYLDFCNSWGPLITGHRHPKIISAIEKQIKHSLTLGIPNELEVELAKRVIDKIKQKNTHHPKNSLCKFWNRSCDECNSFSKRIYKQK